VVDAEPLAVPTLGGFGDRRRDAVAAREAKTPTTFMGMAPTAVKAKPPVQRPDQEAAE